MNHIGAYPGQQLVTWYGRGVPVRVQVVARTHLDLVDLEMGLTHRFRWRDQSRIAHLGLTPATPVDRNPFGIFDLTRKRLELLEAFAVPELEAVLHMGGAVQASVRTAAAARLAALTTPTPLNDIEAPVEDIAPPVKDIVETRAYTLAVDPAAPCEVPHVTASAPEATPSGAPAAPAGPQLLEIALEVLTLDPSLQCRVQMDEGVVEEYRSALLEGAVFPPVKVVRVNGDVPLHLVVDGWHRVAAHERAGRPTVLALVTDGTRRDALLAAAQANADHGLRRTMDDKRRSVRLLLLDPEWCALSSRQLAKLAAVSHTFVDETRARYGLQKGQPLTDAHASHVDGTPSEAWRELKAHAPHWKHPAIEGIRRCTDFSALARQSVYGEHLAAARDLRAREMAALPWPWGDDMTEEDVVVRAETLDTVEDLDRALQSTHVPKAARVSMLRALYLALQLPTRAFFDGCAEAFAGRPALLEALEARKAKVAEELRRKREAEVARRDPYALAAELHRLTDPAEQLAAWKALQTDQERQHVSTDKLVPAVRDGAYRAWADPERTAPTCKALGCGGWVHGAGYLRGCVACGKRQDDLVDDYVGGLETAAQLLAHDGVGVRVYTPFGPAELTAEWVRFVALLQELQRGEHSLELSAWLRKAPERLGPQARKASLGGNAEVLFVDPKGADGPTVTGTLVEEPAEGEEVDDA